MARLFSQCFSSAFLSLSIWGCYGVHIVCWNEVTIPPHTVFPETKRTDGTLGCSKVTSLGKATYLLLEICGCAACSHISGCGLISCLVSHSSLSRYLPAFSWLVSGWTPSSSWKKHQAIGDLLLFQMWSWFLLLALYHIRWISIAGYNRSVSFCVQPTWKWYFLEMFQ